MKDVVSEFILDGITYKLVFDLYVMQNIQNKYKSIANWGNLVEPKDGSEPSIEAIIFGVTEMLNEAIDIDNEKLENKRSSYTERQVARIITRYGIENITNKMRETLISSTETEQSKNV